MVKACNECDLYYEEFCKAKKLFVLRMYNAQVNRSKENGYPPPTYSKNEFIEFGINSIAFHKLYVNWLRSGKEVLLVPSFDRKDYYKGYSFDNFNRWMTWRENKEKGMLDIKNGINNKKSIAVIGINLINGKEVKFYSIKQAERITGIPASNICYSLLGKRKTAGGYKWKSVPKCEI
jgi:hypothetical protein